MPFQDWFLEALKKELENTPHNFKGGLIITWANKMGVNKSTIYRALNRKYGPLRIPPKIEPTFKSEKELFENVSYSQEKYLFEIYDCKELLIDSGEKNKENQIKVVQNKTYIQEDNKLSLLRIKDLFSEIQITKAIPKMEVNDSGIQEFLYFCFERTPDKNVLNQFPNILYFKNYPLDKLDKTKEYLLSNKVNIAEYIKPKTNKAYTYQDVWFVIDSILSANIKNYRKSVASLEYLNRQLFFNDLENQKAIPRYSKYAKSELHLYSSRKA